jgi:acetoin utilization protein AcuC
LIFNFAEKGRPYDFDTPLSPSILEGSLFIMGGALRLGESIFNGTVTRGINLGGGLHHAGESFGGGFCLFNDVAILTKYLQEVQNVKRVLILDYDVHAGNGTSDIFYSDPSVLYISYHQDPKTLYPGTGFIHQVGRGDGEGFNINVPLPAGTSNETYFFAVQEIFTPLVAEFQPEIIIANGGSDPHFADILGGLGLTIDAFFRLSTLVVNTAEEVCQGKVVFLIGSGYNPAVLPLCWYALAAGVVGLEEITVTDPTAPPIIPPWCHQQVETTVKALKQILKKYWRCFR